MKIEHSLGRLRRQLNELTETDYFRSTGRHRAEANLSKLEKKVEAVRQGAHPAKLPNRSNKDYQKRTWVTRQNLYVDRLASAWLIRRFIDPKAKFNFVDANTYRNGAVRMSLSTCSRLSLGTMEICALLKH